MDKDKEITKKEKDKDKKQEKSLIDSIEKLAKKHPVTKQKTSESEPKNTEKDNAAAPADGELSDGKDQHGADLLTPDEKKSEAAEGEIVADEAGFSEQGSADETVSAPKTAEQESVDSEPETVIDESGFGDSEPAGDTADEAAVMPKTGEKEVEIVVDESGFDGTESDAEESSDEADSQSAAPEQPVEEDNDAPESQVSGKEEPTGNEEPSKEQSGRTEVAAPVEKDPLLAQLVKHLKTTTAKKKAEPADSAKESPVAVIGVKTPLPAAGAVESSVAFEAPSEQPLPVPPAEKPDVPAPPAEKPAAPAPVYTPAVPQQAAAPAGSPLGTPYNYNPPVAVAPARKSAAPIPSLRNEKSAAYTLFVLFVAAMMLLATATYLFSKPSDTAPDPVYTDGSETVQDTELEVHSWTEDGLLYLSINNTELIVVNRDNKLPVDYGDGVDPGAKAAYDSMLDAAVRDGVYIYTAADYLDYESQDMRYNRYANYHGESVIDQFMQKAGYSENQLGVAFHVNCSEADYMYSDMFAETPEYAWLANNAADYGFILRYPQGKDALTGYTFSPWHFRYVGVELATLMADSGMVIEEYLQIAEPMSSFGAPDAGDTA